jgi:hypothetical protein
MGPRIGDTHRCALLVLAARATGQCFSPAGAAAVGVFG